MSTDRLQKIIARAGVCSRRKAETLILEGRVSVNGRVVKELGSKADSEHDVVKVDGETVRPRRKMVYIALYKPVGVVTTRSDEKQRPTVMEFLGNEDTDALFPVGRLDYNSEGLLLITNDGEWAAHLMRPSDHVVKTYLVRVRGVPDERTIARLESGIELDGIQTRPAEVEMVGHGRNSWLKVRISEGKKNQLRRMFKKVGHPVVRLKRIGIGAVDLGSLKPGESRRLTAAEVKQLWKSTDAQDR